MVKKGINKHYAFVYFFVPISSFIQQNHFAEFMYDKDVFSEFEFSADFSEGITNKSITHF